MNSLVTEARVSFGVAKQTLFQGGDVSKPINRGAINAMFASLPGTEGAKLKQSFRSAFNNIVYLKTGKAATEVEISKAEEVYMPKPWDTDDVVRQKIRGMETFLGTFAGGDKQQAPASMSDEAILQELREKGLVK